jgi:hypothetical protein
MCRFFLSLTLSIYLFTGTATAQQNLIDSANALSNKWSSFFSTARGPYISWIEMDSLGKFYTSFRVKIINQKSVFFDIQRTNSIISPYRLILTVNLERNSTGVFPQRNKAENAKEKDYTLNDIKNCVFYYDIKNNAWEIVNANEDGEYLIRALFSTNKENINLFADFFSYPIK